MARTSTAPGGAGGTGSFFVSRGARAGTVERTMQRLRAGLFASYYVLQMKHKPKRVLSIISLVIKLIQMLNFPIRAGGRFWLPTIAPLRVLVSLPTISSWFDSGGLGGLGAPSGLYFAPFYLALSWVIVYASLQAWALGVFVRGHIPPIAALRALRFIANVSATVAFIPLVGMLISVWQCYGGAPSADGDILISAWERAGFVCFQGAHLALCTVATLLAVALLGLCALFTLFFFDAHPLSSNIAARAHGRVELVMLLLKVAMVIAFNALGPVIGSRVLVPIAIGMGLAWLSLMLGMMPYVHQVVNTWQVCAACMFIVVGIAALCAVLYPGFDAAVLAYLGLPLAATLGVWLADTRRRRIVDCPTWLLWSPFEAELKVRFMMQAAVEAVLHPRKRSAGEWATDSIDKQKRRGSSRLTRTQSKSLLDVEEGRGDRRGQRTSDAAGGSTQDDETWRLTYAVMDGDTRADFLRERLDTDSVEAANAVLRQAVARFPQSAILHVFIARFSFVFRANRQHMMGHLMQARRLGAPLDVAFLVYAARRTADSRAPADSASALNRVTFEKHFVTARYAVQATAEAQVALWGELSSAAPALDKLHALTSALARETRHAESSFAELFALDPQSIPGLRLLAQFQLVNGNPERATSLLEECERLEDQRMRSAHVQSDSLTADRSVAFTTTFMTQPHGDLDDIENVGVMMLGATTRDLGVILSVNSLCCRMLGFSKMQVERRLFSSMLPPPLGSLLDAALRDYISTGESELVGSTRAMMIRHRNGHVIPVLICLRESNVEEGLPTFTCLLRSMSTPDRFLLLDNSGFVIAACAPSMEQLRLRLDGKSRGVRVERVVQEWDRVFRQLSSPEWSEDDTDEADASSKPVPLRFVPQPFSASSRGLAQLDRDGHVSAPAAGEPCVARMQTFTTSAGAVVGHILMWKPAAEAMDDEQEHDALDGAGSDASERTASLPPGPSRRLEPAMFPAPALKSPSARRDGAKLGVSFEEPRAQPPTLPGAVPDSDARGKGAPARVVVTGGDMSARSGSRNDHPLLADGGSDSGGESARSDAAAHDGSSRSSLGGNDAAPASPERSKLMAPRGGTTTDRGSVASSTKSGITHAVGRLRKALATGDASGFSLHVLRRLHFAYWLVVFVNLILAVAVGASLGAYMTVYSGSFDSALYAATAMSQAFLCINAIRERLVLTRGWSNLAPIYANDTELVNRIYSSSTTFLAATDRLHELANRGGSMSLASELQQFVSVYRFRNADAMPRNTVSEDAIASMIANSTRVPYSIEGLPLVLLGVFEPEQVGYGMYSLGARMTDVSNIPRSSFTTSSRVIPFVHANGYSGAPLHTGMQRIVKVAAYDDSRRAFDTANLLAIALFVAATAVALVMLCIVILPSLQRVKNERDSIMLAFVTIPKRGLTVLRSAAERRLYAIQAANRGDDDEDEDEGSIMDMDNGDGAGDGHDGKRPHRGVLDAPMKNMDVEDIFSQEVEATTDWDALLGPGGAASRASLVRRASTDGMHSKAVISSHGDGAQRTASKYRVGDSDTATAPSASCWTRICGAVEAHMSYARFSLPLLVMCVFYAVIFGVTLQTLLRIDNALAIAITASNRAVGVQELQLNVLFSLSYTGYDVETNNLLNGAAKTLDRLRTDQRYMLLGAGPETIPVWFSTPLPPIERTFRGNEQAGFPELRDSDNAMIRDAMLRNGCPFLRSAYGASSGMAGAMQPYLYDHDADGCEGLVGNFVTLGLSAVFDQLFSTARRVLSRRAATRFDPITAQGVLNTSAALGVVANGTQSTTVQALLASADAVLVRDLTQKVLSPTMSTCSWRVGGS